MAPTRPGAPTRRGGLAKAENRAGLTLIAPTVVIVLVVVVAPIVWSLLLAFQRVRLINLAAHDPLAGFTLHNFATVIAAPGFVETIVTTLVYSVGGTAGSLAVGLLAALALRRAFRARGVLRAVLLLPYVAPVVAVTSAWQTMLSPQFGFVNAWGTEVFGWSDPIAFLSSRSDEVSVFGLPIAVPTALLTVIAFEIWRQFPFAFLFLTARLQAMPASIEEAARVDGASSWQRFWHVTLPLLGPTVIAAVLLRGIDALKTFDLLYATKGKGGGSANEVETLNIYAYGMGLDYNEYGISSAVLIIFFLMIIAVVGVLVLRRERAVA